MGTLIPKNLKSMVDELTRLNIPAYTSGMARGLLGAKHKLLFRHTRKHALKNSDCVILLGVSCDFRVGYGKSFPRKGKVIMINRDKTEAWKNSGAMWNPSKVVIADPSNTFLEICGKVQGWSAADSWAGELRNLDDVKDKSNF